MPTHDQAPAGSPRILPRDNPEPRSQGPRAPEPHPGRGSDYAALSRRIKQAGLLQRRPAWYIVKISLHVLALAVGWAVFLVLGDSWWQLATAVFLAVVFSQLGFVTHDAGHPNPNNVEEDPDVVIGAVAFTTDQALANAACSG